MDPEETLKGALRALAADDISGCIDYLSYYWDWRRNGGAEPRRGDERAELTEKLMNLYQIGGS